MAQAAPPPARPVAVLRYTYQPCSLSHDCIAIQFKLFKPTTLKYTEPSTTQYCNTISTHCTPQGPRSRYNWLLAIQIFFFFTYSLSSSPKTVPAAIFFSSLFISTHSSYWKILKKNIYTYIFFSHAKLNL